MVLMHVCRSGQVITLQQRDSMRFSEVGACVFKQAPHKHIGWNVMTLLLRSCAAQIEGFEAHS